MNLGHLRIFYFVAKEQSFTRAAAVLSIAQPSLSKSIRSFEGTLGVTLFERTTREVRLTNDGTLVFEHAQRIFDDVEKLERSLKRKDVSVKKPLHLGMSDALALALGESFAVFGLTNNSYPILQTGSASELIDLVSRRKLEFALLFHLPALGDSVKSSTIQKVGFKLVVEKSRRRDHAVLERFIGSREVDEEGAKRFPTLEIYRKKNPNASIQFSSNSLITHLELVRRGIGISVLPKFLVETDIKNGLLTDLLPEENLEFNLKVVTHKSFGLTPTGKRCLDHLLASEGLLQ